MEALAANLSTTCPGAFSGATGQLFAGAVAAVVAAHCAFIDDHSWPEDRAQEVFGRTDMTSYDFVIVGAGTAGSLLASRLSLMEPDWSVLLIEAGNDPGLTSEVPGLFFQTQNCNGDWLYRTQPTDKSCLGIRDNMCFWNKGKGLGGSSSINGMLYIRGHPSDYDNWEKSGNAGWDFDTLSKYFNDIEEKIGLNNYEYNENPLYEILQDAYKELDITMHSKQNNHADLGTKITKLMIEDGRRLNTAKLYMKESTKLHVMKNTLVQKVIIDPDTKITKGVEVRHGDGTVMQIYARKEVILSAGSIGTPQLLMLSGIGPKDHLKDKNVEMIMDMPVGRNLQDHVFLPLFLTTNQNITLSPEDITLFLLQYMLTRTGPLSNTGIADFMSFINTKGENVPEIQYHHAYFTTNNDFVLRSILHGFGYKEEIIQAIEKLNRECNLIVIFPSLIYPKSKGEILLADADVKSKPVIKTNYFEDPDDIKTLIRGINFVKKLQETTSFKLMNAKLTQLEMPFCTEFSYDTDVYWECYIRHIATSIYHPVGTAKMGSKDDTSSVVDNELLVHGVKKLRVVDASIMPDIPGANTMATTLVIAEKAADIIKKTYYIHDEL